MNNTVKNTLLFVAGATVGALAAVLVMRKRCDYIIEEEISSMRETLREGLRKSKEKIIDDVEEAMKDELSASVIDDRAQRIRERKEYRDIVGSTRYGRQSTMEELEENEDYHKNRLLTEQAHRAYQQGDDPYIISVEEYSEGNNHYDKLTISFYEDDEVLADENDEVITDGDYIVGLDSLQRFGEESGDPEIVYVRNDKLQIDYEIVRLSKSYAETVLGGER